MRSPAVFSAAGKEENVEISTGYLYSVFPVLTVSSSSCFHCELSSLALSISFLLSDGHV